MIYILHCACLWNLHVCVDSLDAIKFDFPRLLCLMSFWFLVWLEGPWDRIFLLPDNVEMRADHFHPLRDSSRHTWPRTPCWADGLCQGDSRVCGSHVQSCFLLFPFTGVTPQTFCTLSSNLASASWRTQCEWRQYNEINKIYPQKEMTENNSSRKRSVRDG